MGRIERDRLCEILLGAPIWACVGLTGRDPRLRERAADVLTATIIERLDSRPEPDVNQFTLPL